MNTKTQLFEKGREYSRDEVINTLRAAGRKRARMFYNVFGWSVYYTTAPTFATPTGRAAGFPRSVYIFANK